MLETFAEDDCCNKRIVKASRDGQLEGKSSWTCPKCGEEWKPRMIGCALHWEPHPLIAVF
jgi:predicted RNA-binding Zn-ribbon protein involved in translation (DUF1610 family)